MGDLPAESDPDGALKRTDGRPDRQSKKDRRPCKPPDLSTQSKRRAFSRRSRNDPEQADACRKNHMSKTQFLQQAALLRPVARGLNNVVEAIERFRDEPEAYLAQRYRSDTDTVNWEIRKSGMVPKSTGTSDRAQAEAFFELWKLKNVSQTNELLETHLTDIGDIIEEATRTKKPPAKASYSRRKIYARMKAAMEWAKVYFKGKVIYDITQDGIDGFIDSLCGETQEDIWGRALPERDGYVSRVTAEQYASCFMRVLRSRPTPPGAYAWRIDVRVRSTHQPRVTLVTPAEAARMLWACWRGWVWDPEAERWKTERVVDEMTGQMVERRVRAGWTRDRETGRWGPDAKHGLDVEGRRDTKAGLRRAMARYILFYLSTGTRCNTIRGLRWKRNLESGSIAISAKGIVTVHRRGDDQIEGRTKKLASTQLPSRFAAHVRRWARMAAPKPGDPEHWSACAWVVPNEHGGRMGYVWYGFARVVVMGGLNPRIITPHSLKHSCVTWCLENGWTLHRVARMTSTTQEVLERVYAQWIAEFESLGGIMPASVRGNRTLH